MRLPLLLPAFFMLLASWVEAALSPTQISQALESPAEITWNSSVTGSGDWILEDGRLKGITFNDKDTCTLTATVAGPCILQMNAVTQGVLVGRIFVDGVASGGKLMNTPAPVQLGGGVHTITWKFTQEGTYVGPPWINGWVYALGMMLTPLEVLPIAGGSSDARVTLGGGWIGQNLLHHGDGVAAWSGIQVSTPTVSESSVMTGDFEGPGIVSFYSRANGGDASYRLDDRSPVAIHPADGDWRRHYMKAGPGNHRAFWSVGAGAGDFRVEADLAVDEVEILPEVDLATALDTPGRQWTAVDEPGWKWTEPAGVPNPAFGVAMPGVTGGSAVMVPRDATIVTQVAGHALVHITASGGYSVWNGEQVFETRAAPYVEEDGEWVTSYFQMPAPGGEIRISPEESKGVWIDRVEILPLPVSVAEVVGQPDGFTTGGAPWQVAAGVTGRWIASASLTPADRTSWMEFPVTGPARIVLTTFSGRHGRHRFSINGELLWSSAVKESEGAEEFVVEVPQGVHVFRYAGELSGDAEQVAFDVLDLKVEALSGNGINHALGDTGIWIQRGAWEFPAAASPGGSGIIRPLGNDGYGNAPFLSRQVTQPGVVGFRSAVELESYAIPPTWRFSNAISEIATHRASDPYGWSQQQTFWCRGGAGHFEWYPDADEWYFPGLALDSFSFRPSEALDAAAVLGIASSALTNDEEAPWSGWRKQAGEAPVLASPELAPGTESVITATMPGPGLVSFHWKKGGRNGAAGRFGINGSEVAHLPEDGSEGYVNILVEEAGAVLRWSGSSSQEGDWIEIRDFRFSPWVESPIADALDTDGTVEWTTSPEHPVNGRPHHGSKGGSAAWITLGPGEETWLEATVEGPGFFDFFLRDGMKETNWANYPYSWKADWELTVNGRKVALYWWYWPEIFVEGPGPHKIRLTIRNPTSQILTGAVDEVSWRPLAPAPGDAWNVGGTEAKHVFSNGGRDDAPLVLLPRVQYGRQWIETTVTGPGELVWDMRFLKNAAVPPGGNPEFTINGHPAGATIMEEYPEAWQKNRLNVPAGTHVLRWSIGAEDEESGIPQSGYDLCGGWQISGLEFTSGAPEWVGALDDPSLAWLLVGDADPDIVHGVDAWDGVDALRLSGNSLHLHNLSTDVLGLSAMTRLISDGTGEWLPQKIVLQSGEGHAFGVFGFASGDLIVDVAGVERAPLVSIGEALDGAGPFETEGWLGVRSTTARDGVDHAWSALGYGTHILHFTTPGPGRLRFSWRKEEGSALSLGLNHATLPVAEAGPQWSEVAVDVAGDELIQWVHSVKSTASGSMSSAWLDSISFEPLVDWTLSKAVSRGAPVAVDAAPIPGREKWRPVSYVDRNGLPVTAARVNGGGPVMTTNVTGPAMVRFKARCFNPTQTSAPQSTGRQPRSSVIVIGGGGGVVGYELTARLTGQVSGNGVMASISSSGLAGWTEVQMIIPAGNHVLNWRLSELRTSSSNSIVSRNYYIGGDYQAEVADLRITNSRAIFAEWMAEKEVDESLREPSQDADGDGVSNLMEFACGSHPGDSHSLPAAIRSEILPREGRVIIFSWNGVDPYPGATHFHDLYLPYLSKFVVGRLEASDDLKTWQPLPNKLLSEVEPGVGLSGWPANTATHQVHSIPVTSGQPSRFFRLQVTLPE